MNKNILFFLICLTATAQATTWSIDYVNYTSVSVTDWPGYVNFNYSDSSSYIYNNNSYIWQIRHGNLSTYNVTINNTVCSLPLQLRVFSQMSWNGYSLSQGLCYNGSSWVNATNVSSILFSGGSGSSLGGGASIGYDGNYNTSTLNFGGTWYGNPVGFVDQAKFYEQGLWVNRTYNISSCFISPAPTTAPINLTGNYTPTTLSSLDVSYLWYKNGVSTSITTQILGDGNFTNGDNITLQCTLTVDSTIVRINSSTLMPGDNTPPALSALSVSDSDVVRDDVVYFYANCTDSGSIAWVKIEVLDTAGNPSNYTATLQSGAEYRAALAMNAAGTWNYSAVYCQDGSGNLAQNKSVNLTITVTAPASTTGGGGGGSPTVINYNNNLTSSVLQVYEFFVYPVYKNVSYPVSASRTLTKCEIGKPYTCRISGNMAYIELGFNDSYDLLSEITADAKITDQTGSILTVPVRMQVLNLYAYTPTGSFSAPEGLDLLFHVEGKTATGIRYWPFVVIIGFALFKSSKSPQRRYSRNSLMS